MAAAAASGRDVRTRWLSLFDDDTGATFAAHTTSAATLAGSAFLRSIEGRDQVWTALSAAAQIYDRLEFTHSATAGSRSYLEWQAAALGLQMAGVTVLVLDDDGRVDSIAIHHRPLSAALAFSVELRRRLIARMDPTFFYRSSGSEW